MLTLGCGAPRGPPHPDCICVTIPAVSPHHLQDEGPLVAGERQRSVHLAQRADSRAPAVPLRRPTLHTSKHYSECVSGSSERTGCSSERPWLCSRARHAHATRTCVYALPRTRAPLGRVRLLQPEPHQLGRREQQSQVCARDHGLSTKGKLTATSNPGTQAGAEVCLQPRLPGGGPKTVASGRSMTEARVPLSLSLDFGEGALEA